VLVGEYAVLEGGAALSAAVDMRACVTISAAAAEHCELQIANNGEQYTFTVGSDGSPVWRTSPGKLGVLLDAALKRISGNGEVAATLKAYTITLDTRDFYALDAQGARVKVGTGSSAALAVAMTAALQCYYEEEPELDRCVQIHRDFQNGTGSGIDVLTSWYGGVVALQGVVDGVPVTSQLKWLPDLHILPVWTGIPASTSERLARLAVFADRSPDSSGLLLRQLAGSSGEAYSCWISGNVNGFVDQIAQFAEFLTELDEAAQLGIWSDEHRQLQALARKHGATYKPSGAGGGDYGLVFSVDPQPLETLRTELKGRAAPNSYPKWTRQGLDISQRETAS
jgi:phosphomevalonate kinase